MSAGRGEREDATRSSHTDCRTGEGAAEGGTVVLVGYGRCMVGHCKKEGGRLRVIRDSYGSCGGRTVAHNPCIS